MDDDVAIIADAAVSSGHTLLLLLLLQQLLPPSFVDNCVSLGLVITGCDPERVGCILHECFGCVFGASFRSSTNALGLTQY